MLKKIKVAITGHTKGLGKIMYDSFILDGHDVVGFSRSNGYNIKNKDDRNRIILETEECDIFVNNAYNYEDWDNSQLDMLKDIYNTWESNKNKCIINISSGAADVYPIPITIPGIPRYPDYIKAKWEQDRWLVGVRNILNMKEQVRLINLKPGRVLTEKTMDQWKNQNVLEGSSVYKIIKLALSESSIEFSTITFKSF